MSTPPDRQDSILDAAFHAFASYGYRRTSMDDIARGAGFSRTALYLHFRSKEDLFRQLAQRFFEQAIQDVAQALAVPGLSAADSILAALVAKDGKFMAAVMATPHGAELMDAGFAIAGEIAVEGEAQMLALFTGWMTQRGVPADLGTPGEIAAALMVALKGLKSSSLSLPDYRSRQRQLAMVFGRAIGG